MVFVSKRILKFSDLIIVNSLVEKKNIDKLFKKKNTIVISHGVSDINRKYYNKIQKNKKINFVFFFKNTSSKKFEKIN